MTRTLVTLSGYHLTKQIHESDRTLVDRGENASSIKASHLSLPTKE